MNLVKAFTVLALSACTTAGVVAAASVEASTQVAASEALTLYLKPNSNWKDAGAKFSLYYWQGSSNGWSSGVQVEGNSSYYQFTLPAEYSNFSFVRLDPSKTENTWEAKWTQTGDLSRQSNGNNLYTINDGSWTEGYWSKYYYEVNPSNRIYFASEWGSSTHVYSFGSNSYFGSFPGAQMIKRIEMVKYNNHDIYYIDLPNDFSDANIIFNDGTTGNSSTYGHQTDNLLLTVGNMYANDGTVSKSGDANLGLAAQFAKQFNDIRNAATDYSICNISAEDRTVLLSEYNNLNEVVKDCFDNFDLYTWIDSSKSGEQNFKLSAVMAQLASMQNSAASNAARLAPIMDEKKTPYYVIAVIFTLSAATVLFVGVRKRKHN